MTEPGPGTFLIAAPSLIDPNFRRAVVLLCDHNEQSSMGLVINRPMQVPVDKFFPQLQPALGSPAPFVHCGGPVETNRMLVLRHASDDDNADGGGELYHRIVSGVSLVTDIDAALESDADARDDDYRFFLGYAGWGERQLSGELAEEAWIVRPATAELIFETPAAQIWSEALREMGGPYALIADMPLDPTMN